MPSEEAIEGLLATVQQADAKQRHDLAAQLSKVAAKAEDHILIKLGLQARHFVTWLDADEPLVRAYTACILANIAFLEQGQQRVLDADGVPPLVQLLKGKEDKKVTLHATAAIQNLTYKNTACCQTVLENGGEKALKKLLQHKSEDVQQFAAGALANLQLYRRAADEAQQQEKSSLAPPIKKGGINRTVKKILRRRGDQTDSKSSPSSSHHAQVEAAICIQSQFRCKQAQKEVAAKRKRAKKRQKYDTFNVNAVRQELEQNSMLPPLPSQLKRLPAGYDGGLGPGPKRPLQGMRLAPLNPMGGPPALPSLPPILGPPGPSVGMPPPRMGGMPAMR